MTTPTALRVCDCYTQVLGEGEHQEVTPKLCPIHDNAEKMYAALQNLADRKLIDQGSDANDEVLEVLEAIRTGVTP